MSKHLKELTEEQILKAVDGAEDVITPALEQSKKDILKVVCPHCGEQASMRVDPFCPFEAGGVIPNFVPYCLNCEQYI